MIPIYKDKFEGNVVFVKRTIVEYPFHINVHELTRLKHKNLSKFMDVEQYREDGKEIVRTKFLKHEGSLRELTSKYISINEFPNVVHILINDVVSGLEYLHSTFGLVHGNVQPANVLFHWSNRMPTPNFDNISFVIADYDVYNAIIGEQIKEGMNMYLLPYRHPDLLFPVKHTVKAEYDKYAVCMMIIELVTQIYLYDQSNPNEKIHLDKIHRFFKYHFKRNLLKMYGCLNKLYGVSCFVDSYIIDSMLF